jgi:hypothetical protein
MVLGDCLMSELLVRVTELSVIHSLLHKSVKLAYPFTCRRTLGCFQLDGYD